MYSFTAVLHHHVECRYQYDELQHTSQIVLLMHCSQCAFTRISSGSFLFVICWQLLFASLICISCSAETWLACKADCVSVLTCMTVTLLRIYFLWRNWIVAVGKHGSTYNCYIYEMMRNHFCSTCISPVSAHFSVLWSVFLSSELESFDRFTGCSRKSSPLRFFCCFLSNCLEF